jgi:hypothetical protein
MQRLRRQPRTAATNTDTMKFKERKIGSAQEFVETRILGRSLKNDKFGLGDRHALGLEQEVAEILVAAGSDNAVIGSRH